MMLPFLIDVRAFIVYVIATIHRTSETYYKYKPHTP